MSYLFSDVADRLFAGGSGCGPECGCHSCQSAAGGLHQWYEKEEEEEASAQLTPPPQSGPPRAVSARSQPLHGSYPSGSRLGLYYPSRLGFFSQDQEAAQTSPETQEALPGSSSPGGPTYSPDPESVFLQDAIRRGIRDINQLTTMIFLARHPSLRRPR